MPGGVAPVYDGGIPQRSQSYRVPSERDLQRAQSSTTHYPEARYRASNHHPTSFFVILLCMFRSLAANNNCCQMFYVAQLNDKFQFLIL